VTAPRLEIDLDLIGHNARTLVGRLAVRGVSVTGVTKATLGSIRIARELVTAGVTSLGESRIENIEALRRGGIRSPITLIRSPMISQAHRVVAHADLSLNTELSVLGRLSGAAGELETDHGVVLMVELGDLREGILPEDLEAVVAQVLRLPHLTLRGIGANLACQSGVAPDSTNMAELSALVVSLESRFGVTLEQVSGGNSANLDWALGHHDVGRINDLRLGESILLGCETLQRRPLDGLRTDAFTLVAEVIESKIKPSTPWGDIHQSAFGYAASSDAQGDVARVILGLGRQDVEPDGLRAPEGMAIIGSSSDHLILRADHAVPVAGSEVELQVCGYGALLSAMTSPFVTKVFRNGSVAT
jgi:ornithine racemase